MDDSDLDPAQKRAFRKRMNYRRMLNEWYGSAYAAREIAMSGPRAELAAHFVDGVTRSVFSKETEQKMTLEAHWSEIVGEQFAAISQVTGLSGGVLTLGVRHSAFRKELENSLILLQSLIQRYFGEVVCREIRLEAANRRRHSFGVIKHS